MYRESEIIELKREYTADIRKEIIAFANTYINSYESARSLQQKLTFVCKTHCYASTYRDKIREIMRYGGPRMLFVSPIQVVRHMYLEWKDRKRSETFHEN